MTIKCRLCKFEGRAICDKKLDIGVAYRCSNCDSVCLDTKNPEFSYIFSGRSNAVSLADKVKRYMRARFNEGDFIQAYYFKWLSDKIDIAGIRNVLDIGCGKGMLLSLFNKAGKHVSGIEPDADMVMYSPVREKIRIEYFDAAMTFNERFDLVILGQCIDYYYNPIEILKKIDMTVNDRGYIFITAHNTMDDRIFDGLRLHAPSAISKKLLEDFFKKNGYQIIATDIMEPLSMKKGNILGRLSKNNRWLRFISGIMNFYGFKFSDVYKREINAAGAGYHVFFLARKK
ncbi:MAG: class I SAM-dependent methyltransferase [Deltaproteobacteria bacterium]|nr:class I SAM-dependent methyltransferase [Deltaproteobacteria bacterium]